MVLFCGSHVHYFGKIAKVKKVCDDRKTIIVTEFKLPLMTYLQLKSRIFRQSWQYV